jgi:hypothetical protein
MWLSGLKGNWHAQRAVGKRIKVWLIWNTKRKLQYFLFIILFYLRA